MTAAVDEPPLPSFEASPWWVAATARRERWWFADGAWLNGGTSSAVVSLAVTQWCADRGLKGEGFDEQFALALAKEVNRAQGWDENADQGEFPWTVLRVMRERGLVAEVYRCENRDALTTALLERGPLLAGLNWSDTFGKPKRVGDTFVARPGRVTGGHSVVLDGIDLDLELAGVKGFVRFKNTWSRTWADHGHCLISLDDLEAALDEPHQVYFLLPEREALRPGLREDVAIPAERPSTLSPRAATRYAQQSIGSDRWTMHDSIGYAAHAEAIARAICHPETAPPLTIGIKGPWGAGKTSLMRMVQDRLEWPTGRPADESQQRPRRIHLTGSGAEAVTNGLLLETAQQADAAPEQATAAPQLSAQHAAQEERRWRPTVWFNPWMYQTGNQVWAGLAHETITQITERMSRVEQEFFWMRLNRARIDEGAVRRRIYGLVVSRVIPWAIAGLLLLVAGAAALAAGVTAAAALVAAGPVLTAVATAVKLRRVLAEPARGALAEALGPSAFQDLVRAPDYEGQSGPLFLISADLERVLDLVATPERPLVIFIDDLDRCNPGTVIEVIEAINLFVAGQYPNTIFVIAMEPEMVAAHVEAAYSDLAQRLGGDGARQSFDLGWRFLEKIVQLPLTLPTVGKTRAQGYVASLFAPEAGPGARESAPDEVEVHVAEQELADVSVEGAMQHAGSVGGVGNPQPEAVKEAVRRVVEKRLSTDSPEVQGVVNYAALHLDDNPREIKRFVNVFRYFVMIATERQLQALSEAVALDALAKMAILLVRWPGLLSALTERVGDSETVLMALEKGGAHDELRTRLVGSDVPEHTVDQLLAHELTALLAGAPKVGAATDGFL